MISALLYLQIHSFVNRVRSRVRRLKKPKYLIGAIVGGLYLFWYFHHVLFPRRPAGESPGFLVTTEPAVLECLAALIPLIWLASQWIFRRSRAALGFSEAEIAFLFPAPVSRRGLLHYKLLSSQIPMLFSVAIMAILSSRILGGHGWFQLAGWWILLWTLTLHSYGSSFALTLLMDRGLSTWRRRVAVLGLLAAGLSVAVVWAWRTLPPPPFDLNNGLAGLKSYGKQLLVSGPIPNLLYPFRLIVRPFLAGDAIQFLSALGPALAILSLHYVWVVRSNVAFEEASIEYSKKLAERAAAIRAGRAQPGSAAGKRKPDPFRLQPDGAPCVGLLWKNLIAAGQTFTPRAWAIVLAVLLVAGCVARGMGLGDDTREMLGILAAAFTGMSLFWGPFALQQDLRQDLRVADILKTYPVSGWQTVLGEVLTPTVILTTVQWALLLVALTLLPSGDSTAWATSVSLGVSAAILAPALNGLSLLILNAAALYFPAWFLPDPQSPQGFEVTGQRILMFLGQFVVVGLALLPAAVVSLAVFFTASLVGGHVVATPLAAMAAAATLAAECAYGIFLLGRVFDRLDLSDELNP